MVLYNAKPRPRALFIGFDESDLSDLGAGTLFPTYGQLSSTRDIHTVRQSEYEVVICLDQNDLSSIEFSPCVISLGGETLGRGQVEDVYAWYWAGRQFSVATEFILPDKIDAALKNLTEQTLLPILRKESRHPILDSMYSRHISTSHWDYANFWSPLVSDGDNKALIGYGQRSKETLSELWYLHEGLDNKQLNKWFAYLLQRWGQKNSDAFPNSKDWKQDPKWQSVSELSVMEQIASADAKFQEAQKKHDEEIETFKQDLETATREAESGIRALLTTQGDDLKDSVIATLNGLGLTVTDMDTVRAAEGQGSNKLEDLRISPSSKLSGTFTALSEVRGYIKGAKVSDLIRLSGRFSKQYMQENKGKAPEALWYIVNHDLAVSPNDRQPALKEQPSDIKAFSEEGGLIIDTVELFQLKQLVDKGVLTKDQAIDKLMNSTGYFQCTPTNKKVSLLNKPDDPPQAQSEK